MKTSGKLFPLFVVALGLVWLAVAALPPSDPQSGFRLHDFARLPVQENGRLMPFDTFARTKLMLVSHRQSVKQEVYTKEEYAAKRKEKEELRPAERDLLVEIAKKTVDGRLPTKSISATEWALDALSLHPEIVMQDNPFYDAHMFRIDNDDLLQFLDLKPSPQFGLYFKLHDFFGPDKPKFMKQAKNIIDAGGPAKDSILDNKIADLYQRVGIVYRLASLDVPFLIPPVLNKDENIADEKWLNLPSAFQIDQRKQEAEIILKMLQAHANGKPAPFNEALDRYLDWFKTNHPEVLAKNDSEVFFNRFAPFYQCIVLFVFVKLLVIASWFLAAFSFGDWAKSVRTSAWALGLLTMLVYTWALVLRIYISGYAPVTNLYSSAVFIGWGCALLCFGLELILRNGIGSFVAAVTGTASLIVAHNLLDGDSMGKLVAVLESNFWLSTHVICITFGYTATFVAGFLGIVYVIAGIFTNGLRGHTGYLLHKVIYGVICFALFLSFVGTVLGGIWADQSWGRFWGWDPKENGALLIVIWNAIILHARWAGMLKPRGLAVLAIAGNIVTSWSWFGTNLLGVGLHSYGFTKGAMISLFFFDLSQVLLILIGLTPLTMWKSFRSEAKPVIST